MIKAGFVPIEPERVYEDLDLGLVGKPWRILQKGSLRIPVFRKRADSRQIHPQHLLRIVAYCHLIRKCEGADSPYGIVLQGREYEGVALPAKDSSEALRQAIKRVRQMQYAVEVEGLFPNAPDPLSRCRGCPWGKPRRHRNRKSETILSGQVVEPFLARGSDKHLYHSTCGDRCYWVPPHERAEALSLSRS